MTDPRMTPTNDAPVTVEQAIDAEVARIMAMSDEEIMREADVDDAAWARGFKLGLASGKSAAAGGALQWYAENVAGCRKIGRDGDAFRQALDADGGKRALAALASAPAGDGVSERDWIMRAFYAEIDRQCGIGAGMAQTCADSGLFQINADIDMHSLAAALARPRAAVPPGSDAAYFGASDAACTLYPGADQQAERAAFCEGAAYAVSSPRAAVGERVTPALHEGGRFREWQSIDLAQQCLAQAREQLDPEFSQFMTAVAERLALQSPPAKVEG